MTNRNDPPPADDEIRKRVTAELERSVSVEASAGTGKTYLMTGRVMELARHFGDLECIAVLTFGEAAAAELRRRIRDRIRDLGNRGESGKLRHALMEQLPGAYITTIHSFASSMLREYSHLTGVDPSFDIREQSIGKADLEMLWEAHLLEDIDLMISCGELLDLCGDRLPSIALELAMKPRMTDPEALFEGRSGRKDGCRANLDRLAELISRADQTDRYAIKLKSFASRASDFLDEAISAAGLLESFSRHDGSRGRGAGWPGDSLEEAKALFTDLKKTLPAIPFIDQFIRLLLPFVEKLRNEREADLSTLTFDEILVRFEKALERSEHLRETISKRFRHILIDEYQDTSSEQVMIFRRILEECGGYRKGSITVVGDPKQSIYAWRQADLELYNEERAALEGDSGKTLSERITVCFRSSPAVIALVNAIGPLVFDGTSSFDCGYSPFEPQAVPPVGPKPLVVLIDDIGDGSRRIPKSELVQTAADWTAGFLKAKLEAAGEVEPSDWAVLMRTGTHAGQLLSSLAELDVRYSATVGRAFRKRQETADLREMAACLLYPGAREALIHVLRSPFFGIDDLEITKAVQAGLSNWTDPPPGMDRTAPQAARACRMLSRLRAASRALPVADFLQLLLQETESAHVMAALKWEAGRKLANYGYLLEQAFGGAYPTLFDLHQALIDEDGRGESLEEPSPVSSRGTVSVTTIHKAKGLTFENMILMSPLDDRKGSHERERVEFHDHAGKAAVRFAKLGRADITTPLWDELKQRKSLQEMAEVRRLIYVALTRPRKALVILARKSTWDKPPEPAGYFDAILVRALRKALDNDRSLFDVETIPCRPTRRSRRRPVIKAIPSPDERPLPASPFPAPVDPESPFKGNAAALGLGDAVHRVMEKIDFTEPAAWLERTPLPFESSGIDPSKVIALAGSFFEMDLPFDPSTVKIVSREYPYLKLTPGGYRSSFVDLIVEHGGRLYALDYKTDRVTADQVGAQAAVYLEKQQGYGQDLADALGREVGVWLAFLSPGKTFHVGDFSPNPR